MFSLSQLLRTLDTASPADCNSTLDISHFFFFLFFLLLSILAASKRSRGKRGPAAEEDVCIFKWEKARKVKALARIHRQGEGGAKTAAGAAEAPLPRRVAFINAKGAVGSAAFGAAGGFQEKPFYSSTESHS